MHRVMKALQFKKCIAPSSLSISHNFHNCQSPRISFFISKHPNKIFVSFFFNVINIFWFFLPHSFFFLFYIFNFFSFETSKKRWYTKNDWKRFNKTCCTCWKRPCSWKKRSFDWSLAWTSQIVWIVAKNQSRFTSSSYYYKRLRRILWRSIVILRWRHFFSVELRVSIQSDAGAM